MMMSTRYRKTLSIVLAPGILPVASRLAVKRSTDWASPLASKESKDILSMEDVMGDSTKSKLSLEDV